MRLWGPPRDPEDALPAFEREAGGRWWRLELVAPGKWKLASEDQPDQVRWLKELRDRPDQLREMMAQANDLIDEELLVAHAEAGPGWLPFGPAGDEVWFRQTDSGATWLLAHRRDERSGKSGWTLQRTDFPTDRQVLPHDADFLTATVDADVFLDHHEWVPPGGTLVDGWARYGDPNLEVWTRKHGGRVWFMGPVYYPNDDKDWMVWADGFSANAHHLGLGGTVQHGARVDDAVLEANRWLDAVATVDADSTEPGVAPGERVRFYVEVVEVRVYRRWQLEAESGRAIEKANASVEAGRERPVSVSVTGRVVSTA